MDPEINIPPRVKALFALSKLSADIQSAVLADRSLISKFEIAVSNPVRLKRDLVVDREILFAALQASTDGAQTVPIHDVNGEPIISEISFEQDGSGIIKIGNNRIRFPYAILLSKDISRRIEALNHLLLSLTLEQSERRKVRELVEKTESYRSDDFFKALQILDGAPENLEKIMRSRIEAGNVGRDDLLPENVQYWGNLIATRSASTNLDEFLIGELATERNHHLSRDAVMGFKTISLSFSSPATVPLSMFDDMEPEKLALLLSNACDFDDHFSAVGAFEICCAHLQRGEVLTPIGTRLLDRLFSDMRKLSDACKMFAAAFVIAVGKLSDHTQLQLEPPYWRRLAATSHASLVVRASGMTNVDYDGLIDWAVSQSGETYFLSTFLDFYSLPRWRPEWIEDRFLVADAVGRTVAAFNRIPASAAPDAWKTRIDSARNWLRENHTQILANFPAINEGQRKLEPPNAEDLGPLTEGFDRFIASPSVDNLLILTPIIQTFGLPTGLNGSLRKVLEIVGPAPADRKIDATLTILAQSSVFASDTELASAIASLCVERIKTVNDRQSLIQLIFRIVECCAAWPEMGAGRHELIQRLEQVSFVASAGARSTDVLGILENLRLIDLYSSMHLGRAIAAARMGSVAH